MDSRRQAGQSLSSEEGSSRFHVAGSQMAGISYASHNLSPLFEGVLGVFWGQRKKRRAQYSAHHGKSRNLKRG